MGVRVETPVYLSAVAERSLVKATPSVAVYILGRGQLKVRPLRPVHLKLVTVDYVYRNRWSGLDEATFRYRITGVCFDTDSRIKLVYQFDVGVLVETIMHPDAVAGSGVVKAAPSVPVQVSGRGANFRCD